MRKLEAIMEIQQSMMTAIIAEKDRQIKELEIQLRRETETADFVQALSDIPSNPHMIPITELSFGRVNNAVDTLSVYPTSCVPFGDFSGIEKIQVPKTRPFIVVCDSKIAGPGWMVIQRHFGPKISFNQNWHSYLSGFGTFKGDFFIGLNILHSLTKYQQHELYVQFEDLNGKKSIAKYDNFRIGNESENFRLESLGTFSGNALDFMRYHENQMFSTYDRENHNHKSNNCAREWNGGWWFNKCAYV